MTTVWCKELDCQIHVLLISPITTANIIGYCMQQHQISPCVRRHELLSQSIHIAVHSAADAAAVAAAGVAAAAGIGRGIHGEMPHRCQSLSANSLRTTFFGSEHVSGMANRMRELRKRIITGEADERNSGD